ncbi:MAG: glycosyltransferase family 4 protein [Sphingomonas sp.]
MRALLIQPGARHAYAFARFLHDADALQRLYTDFAVSANSVEHHLLKLALGTRPGRRLSRRVVHGLPASALRRHSLGEFVAGRLWPDAPERWKFLKRDLREADIIYSQYFIAGSQFDELTAHGARFVSDVFIMPSAHRIGSREAIRFPDWGEAPLSTKAGATLDAVSLAMIERSHVLFCPSQSVIDDVATYIPSARAKCRLVRYGSSLSFPEPSRAIRKRVLFAGTITLRKGPQYLKLVADRIARVDPEVRFVFAGGVSEAAAKQLRAPNVELLGHISRERMREEFLRADLFAFPSLAEGSAGVVLEAMAAGLPIVATREAGVEFADGKSGIVVPPTNVEALEEAILAIVRNRSMRDDMARSARAEFNLYDDQAWSAAFVGALRDVATGR